MKGVAFFSAIVYKSPLYNGREFRVKTKRKGESDQYFYLNIELEDLKR